jgi:hypothetical protein
MTNKNLKGVGEIHQGKRFLHNCTHVQLVGNSSRNEYSKTRCTVINPPSVTGKNLGTVVKKSANTTQGWKSAKLAYRVSLAPALIRCSSLFSLRTVYCWNKKKKPTHPDPTWKRDV